MLAGRGTEAHSIGRETLTAHVRREAPTRVLAAQLERTFGWAEVQLGDPKAARRHFVSSLAEARGLDALTLRARLALPGDEHPEPLSEAAEADGILDGLGVVAVPDVVLVSTSTRGDGEPCGAATSSLTVADWSSLTSSPRTRVL